MTDKKGNLEKIKDTVNSKEFKAAEGFFKGLSEGMKGALGIDDIQIVTEKEANKEEKENSNKTLKKRKDHINDMVDLI